MRIGRRGIRVRNMRSFDIFAFLELRGLGLGILRVHQFEKVHHWGGVLIGEEMQVSIVICFVYCGSVNSICYIIFNLPIYCIIDHLSGEFTVR